MDKFAKQIPIYNIRKATELLTEHSILSTVSSQLPIKTEKKTHINILGSEA